MLNEILRGLAQDVPEPVYAPHREAIRSAFSHDRAETIVSSLVSQDTEWSREQAALLRSRSPETIKLALRQLRRGAQMKSFEDNMRMEYRIGWRKVQSHDFLEGVRAVIIDKDNAPSWKPARLEDVSDEDVERYFAPLGADELNFDP
jgi:enoyl-CoA hydratase